MITSPDRAASINRFVITNIDAVSDAVSDALDNGAPMAPPPVVPDGAITGRHLH